MNIDDFKIQIKKYDRVRQVVTANVIVCELIEIRGYQTRFTETSRPPSPRWVVSPPAVRKRGSSNKYFWIVKIMDTELWHQLYEKIIQAVIEYTNNH